MNSASVYAQHRNTLSGLSRKYATLSRAVFPPKCRYDRSYTSAVAAALHASDTSSPAANRFPPVSGETRRISAGYSGKNTSRSRSSPTAV